MSRSQTIRTSTLVERKQADLPRYAVVPAAVVSPWNLTTTTTIEVAINGVPVARRSIHRWDDERWFISITQQDCRALNIETGSRMEISLQVASADLPEELADLMRTNQAARRTWDALTPSTQRMVREEVGSGKQAATRARRARRSLLGE